MSILNRYGRWQRRRECKKRDAASCRNLGSKKERVNKVREWGCQARAMNTSWNNSPFIVTMGPTRFEAI
jgi:hypothetical protein